MATTNITEKNFHELTSQPGIVLIDFWAPWCAPCRAFGPVFEKVSEKFPNVVFGKVNTQEEQRLAGSLGIRSIPTLMIFRDGVLLFAQPGMLPGHVLEDLVNQTVGLDMDEVRKEVENRKAARSGASQTSAQA